MVDEFEIYRRQNERRYHERRQLKNEHRSEIKKPKVFDLPTIISLVLLLLMSLALYLKAGGLSWK